MSTTSYDYDLTKPRGSVNPAYKGLRWRRNADGSYSWEFDQNKNGRQDRTTLAATTEREAIAEWEILRGKLGQGMTVVATGKATVGDARDRLLAAIDTEIANGTKKAKTKEIREIDLRLHILPYFGENKRLKSISTEHVAAFIASLKTEKGLSNNTRISVTTTLGQLFKVAKRAGWIAANPVADLETSERAPQEKKRVSRVLRVDDLALMIEWCNPLFLEMLIVLAYTGLRVSELCGLAWEDIDFDKKRINVRQQLGENEDGKLCARVDPKGKAGRATRSERTVRILPATQRALERQLELEKAKGFGNDWDFVFTTTTNVGHPYRPDGFRPRGVQAAAEAAGLGRINPHDLRHTTASIFAEAGISIPAAARMMGHTIEEYVSTYAHAFEDEQEFEAIEASLARIGFGIE